MEEKTIGTVLDDMSLTERRLCAFSFAGAKRLARAFDQTLWVNPGLRAFTDELGTFQRAHVGSVTGCIEKRTCSNGELFIIHPEKNVVVLDFPERNDFWENQTLETFRDAVDGLICMGVYRDLSKGLPDKVKNWILGR